MPLLPKISFSQQDAEGKVVEILDKTGLYATNNLGGYNSPNLAISSAYARYRIANYNSLESLNTVTIGNLTARKEYVKTVGSDKVYDGINVGVGDIYVPTAAIAVQSGDTFDETGFYVPLITAARYRPSTTVPIYLNGTELGLNTTDIIPDTILPIEYQVYGAILTSPTSVNQTTYLVQSNSTTYNGSSYKIGDVFTAIGTTAIVGTVSPFVSSYFNTFQSTFNIKAQLIDIQVSNILNPKPNSAKLNVILANLYSRINTIEMIDGLGNVSLTNAYDNLTDIAQTCTNIENNNY
jgi:hypothetical protein